MGIKFKARVKLFQHLLIDLSIWIWFKLTFAPLFIKIYSLTNSQINYHVEEHQPFNYEKSDKWHHSLKRLVNPKIKILSLFIQFRLLLMLLMSYFFMTFLYCLLVLWKGRNLTDFIKNISICLPKINQKSYVFGTTQRWVSDDRIFYFGVTLRWISQIDGSSWNSILL